MRLACDSLGKGGRNAGLADPRLARDQDNLSLTFPGKPLALQQEVDLVIAADYVSQTGHPDRFKAAFGSRQALDRPRGYRLGNALDFVLAKIAQPEQISEQPARRGCDDDRPRLSQIQKSSRNIRRVPDHRVLP